MEKSIQLPVAWIERLQDYIAEVDKLAIDNDAVVPISRLLGYLSSLETLIKEWYA